MPLLGAVLVNLLAALFTLLVWQSRSDGLAAAWTAGLLVLLAIASAVVVYLVQGGGLQRGQVLPAEMTVNEDRQRRLYESTPAMLHAIDLDYRLMVVSDAWLAKLGYTREEVLGRRSIDFMTEASRRFVREVGLPALMKKGIQIEAPMQMVTRSGEVIDVLISAVVERDLDGRALRIVAGIQDVTLRRRAELELQEERQRLQNILDGTGAGTWQHDLATGGYVVNGNYAAMLGYSLDEFRGLAWVSFLEFVHPGDRRMLEEAHRAHVEGRTAVCESEFRLHHRAGHWIWVFSRGSISLRDDAGQARAVSGIHLDITARKQVERELHRERLQLGNILEGTNAGTWEWNVETGECKFNERWARISGHSLTELGETCIETWSQLLHPDDIAPTSALLDRHFNGETPYYEAELRVRHVDGSWVWVLDRGKLLSRNEEGRPRWMAGIRLDIHKRKLAEIALQHRERLMRLVIDAFPSPLAHWDAEMRCTIANRAYLAWMGLDPEQMLGRTQRELIGAAMYERNEPSILAALRGEVQHLERSRVVADGRQRHYILHYLPDRDGDKVRGFISVVVDVSEMKQVQLQLQERTAQAEQANTAKSQFLANMSHEIRTPMNAILGMLALLRKTELTACQSDYARKTEGAARSLLGLLNDILDFSKAEAGKMTMDPHPFRMDQVLRDLAVILSANVNGKSLEVLFDIDPELPRDLIGDAMRLQQVLINLGGNAIKFTEEGEVVVSVDVVTMTDHSVTIEVGVRDTGIGIAPEHRDRIFSGFTQAEASTTRRYGGSGLGLAICQRMVALMGGSLQLDSVAGKGSRFYFRISLPRVVGDEDDRRGSHGRAAISMRVLVVDDNAAARDVAARMVRTLGWSADLVDSGEAALAALQDPTKHYDSVFVDWQMPGLDGWETARRIRELPGMARVPTIVMVTAHGRDTLSTRPAEDQALIDGFLVKPVTASMLYDAIVDAGSASSDKLKPVKPSSAAPRLAGMRLLVAEDNANNQQVARELLEGEGAEVVIARNGLEALEAVAAADPPFDAVLMDLQMPVMDGYSTTSRIRHDLAQQTLPIIAMTANAMSSDREACLSAGMNEHVGKPFDLDHLVAVLRRLAGRQTLAAPVERGAGRSKAVETAVLHAAEAAGVSIEAALRRLGSNRKVYSRTLRGFVNDLRPISTRLLAASTRAAWAEASRSLHTLTGVAGTVGAMALAECAGKAEAAVLTAATPDRGATVREVADGIAAMMPALEALCRVLDAGGRTASACPPGGGAPLAPGDIDALTATLQSVSRMLANSDLEAIEALRGLRTQLPCAAGDRLDTLEEATESLDFEAALAHCKDWLKDCAS